MAGAEAVAMMTEQEEDEAYDICDDIANAIHFVVAKELRGLTEEQADFIRGRLQEQFRFWS